MAIVKLGAWVTLVGTPIYFLFWVATAAGL